MGYSPSLSKQQEKTQLSETDWTSSQKGLNKTCWFPPTTCTSWIPPDVELLSISLLWKKGSWANKQYVNVCYKYNVYVYIYIYTHTYCKKHTQNHTSYINYKSRRYSIYVYIYIYFLSSFSGRPPCWGTHISTMQEKNCFPQRKTPTFQRVQRKQQSHAKPLQFSSHDDFKAYYHIQNMHIKITYK